MTPPAPTPGTASGWACARPWRSARLGWAVAALALVGGVPLFLCMPPWCDVTLYDVAARTVLRGGVHYRDVFDTNLPGVVWVMAAIRAAFGPGYEALRACDLLIVGAAAAVLGRWAVRAGATPAAVGWYAAAVALYYPFASEINHCQRDAWMLLPAAAAGWMRLGQTRRAADPGARFVLWSVGEGVVWGLAVWIKPHVVVPAAAVWGVSAVVQWRAGAGKRVGADFLGLVAGGVLAGTPGVAWLVGTGAWPYFWDIFTQWNPAYMDGFWRDVPAKAEWAWTYFRPWSLLRAAAIPLAVYDVWVGLVRARGPGAAADRAALAALYLGWDAQAVVLQQGLDYVHVPPVLLALAVLAARGWAVGFPLLVWFAANGAVYAAADRSPKAEAVVAAVNGSNPYVNLERHPLTDPNVLRWWPACWREGGSLRQRDRLGQFTDVHSGINWEDLGAVAGFLRTVEPPLGDGELTCWNDTTHPLYLMLGLEPSTRYMHFGTALNIRAKADVIRRDVAASRQRYVVSDLRRMTRETANAAAPGAHGPRSLPAWFPRSLRSVFPWDQPVVFRSGRYLVHAIDHPPSPDRMDIPHWYDIDDLGPGE